MKIVILNECFFNERHISKLKELGPVDIYNDTSSEEEVIERLQGVEIAIVDPFFCTSQ